MRKQFFSSFLQMFATLFGISIITFGLIFLAPGDPVETMYLSSGFLPPIEIIENTREAMGLNDPFHIQYWNWIQNVLKGDFGMSYSLNRPVTEAISFRLIKSFHLAITSLFFTLLISFPFGFLSAIYQNKFLDYLIRGYTFIGISAPSFLVGTLLLYIVALKWHLLPVVSQGDGFTPLILPSITLAFSMSAKYIRQIRSIVLEELNKEYVLGAKARGISFVQILVRDVFPNTFPPLLTLLAISFGSLLSGVAVVEVIFSYPGIGSLAVSAISSYDYPLIQAYVLIISFVYMVCNLCVDFLYPFLDPRLCKQMNG